MSLRPTYSPLQVGREPDEAIQPLNAFMRSTVDALRTVPKRQLVVVKFHAPATATDAFPLDVTLQDGMVPRSVVVGRVINWRNPDTAQTVAYFVDWQPSDRGIRVRNIVGAAANSEYEITLEVTGE